MDIQKMINDYIDWLKSEITFHQVGEYYEITAPYLDRHNDYLQIYIKQESDGNILLTDDGYIVRDLISSGFSFTDKRKDVLNRILRNYNITLDGNTMNTIATMHNFPQKKHMMLQAMLMVDDMFVTNRSNVENFFYEDVEAYFNSIEVYPTKNFSLVGKTGEFYSYDFHFQRTKNKPERFCKMINRLRKQSRDITMFYWTDTKETRQDDSNLIVVINDKNGVSENDINVFKNYEIETVLFSERNEQKNIELFTA